MKTLTKLLIFSVLAIPPVFAQRSQFFSMNAPSGLTLAPGWTFLQERPNFGCSTGTASCNTAAYSTTSGSVWIAFASTGNNLTMSSVSNSSGSWQPCPASACHAFNTGNGGVDAMYNLTGTAGSTTMTINMSGSATGFFYTDFIELLPPAGFSASLDTSGSNTTTSCSTACSTVALTLSATDAVVQITNAPQLIAFNGPFAFGSPYLTSGIGSGIALNTNTAAGTTFGFDPSSHTGTSWIGVSALAFKTTANTFSTQSPVFSFTNLASTFTLGNPGGLTCSPGCPAFTIPSTGAGHLLLVQFASANGKTLSSVSDNQSNTWVVPTGANTCAISNGTDSLGCAYVLSSASGTTTLTFTMNSGTATAHFVVYEITRTTGSFTLDAQGSTSNSASSNITMQSLAGGCTGCSGSLSGSNDVIFHQVSITGGPSGETLCIQPFINKGSNAFGGGYTFAVNYSNTGIILNSVNGNAPLSAGPSNPSVVGAIAFK